MKFNPNNNYDEIIERWNTGQIIDHEHLANEYGYKNKDSARKVLQRLKEYGYNILSVQDRIKLAKENIGIKTNLSLTKSNILLQDKNRVINKINREQFRVENTLNELNSEVYKILKKHNLKDYTRIKTHKTKLGYVGIIHITDTHLNELIDLPQNKYDFNIASKRLQKLVIESKRIFKAYGVKKVILANTGDNINSDRRLDEMTAMATNRMSAMMLAVIIFQQVILDLNKDFDVNVLFVSGNESRVKDEFGYGDFSILDNYDFSIYNILELLFKGSKTVSFISDKTNFSEKVVEIEGKNFLFLHGTTIKGDLYKSIQSVYGKYAARGIILEQIIFGHIHACFISDIFARASSLCGGNDFSDKGLQLISKASQNIFMVDKKNTNSLKVDLQNYDGYIGYDISKELAQYNTKSADKLNSNPKIVKIII